MEKAPKHARARRGSIAASRWKRAGRIGLALVLVATVIAIATPYAAVAVGTKRAAACLASYQTPRQPSALPTCAGEIEWFVRPSRIAWTRDAASYRGEELNARIAIASYLDAAVGRPDKAELARTGIALAEAAKVVQEGSQRIVLDDLGPSVGAPSLGRSAALIGDRRTLLARTSEWPDWHVRLQTLHAALIEGDLPLAIATAKIYAELDPRDEDLRTATAALLCLGPDAKRGIEMLTAVQNDRASRRYAAMARNWGDVRAALVACAARARVVPPPKPENSEAGQGDRAEARAVLRLRLASSAGGEAGDTGEREHDAVVGAMDLLVAGARSPGARAELLAVVMASGHAPDAAKAADLARPRGEDGEPPLLRSPVITALDWLREPRGQRPFVHAATFERAAERLRSMSIAPDTPADALDTLRKAAGALWLEAARARALAGDGHGAVAAVREGGALVIDREDALTLARSSAWYVAGDVEAALAELPDAPTLQAGAGADPVSRRVAAAALIQRAELLAAQRVQRAEPGSRPTAGQVAEAALIADRVAAEAGDVALDARARWTRLALVRSPEGAPLRPGTEINVGPLRHVWAGPAAQPAAGWPWVGAIAPDGRPQPPDRSGQDSPSQTAQSGAPPADLRALDRDRRWEGPLSRSLSMWSAARTASSEDRLALRYAVLRIRGDASPAPLPYLSLASDLLGDQGDVEVWLDTFTALDTRVMSHRMYAWLRVQAARWRGDEDRAALWTRRLQALAAIASDPERAELAIFLGI